MANEQIKSLLKRHSISYEELGDAIYINSNRVYKTSSSVYVERLLKNPLSTEMENMVVGAIDFIDKTRETAINSFKDSSGNILLYDIRFHLTRRTYNTITRTGIKTTNDLFNMTECDFRKRRLVGSAVVVEIKKLGDIIGKSFLTNDDYIYQKVFSRLNFKPNQVVELDELVKTIIRYTREEIGK